MAAKEMYDYLSSLAADYTTTELAVKPDTVIIEEGQKNQVVHTGDDGSEEIVTRSNTTVFYAELQWKNRNASDAGTIFDFYHDTAKGNGISRTFYWPHGTDGHTYTARFDGPLSRSISQPEFHGFTSVRLRIKGNKP